jgi:hypothetical protein
VRLSAHRVKHAIAYRELGSKQSFGRLIGWLFGPRMLRFRSFQYGSQTLLLSQDSTHKQEKLSLSTMYKYFLVHKANQCPLDAWYQRKIKFILLTA